MKPFTFLLALIVVFWSSQVLSKKWVDYPVVRDMTYMTEYQKAYEYLNERGEVDLAIYPGSPFDLKPLVNTISIIHVEGGKVIASADRAGFKKFLEYGFDYEVQTPVMMSGPVPMSDYSEYLEGTAPADWFTYPTYGAYVAFLEKWAEDFPEIAKLYNLGPSGVESKNHHIYAMRISDNVEVNECEPRYLETNTIHGDEVLNLMNCLHMIDTILNSYGSDDRITKLVDSLEMWFIPNMNPDGTYPSGDNTVKNAQRANVADRFDLNRNSPCPCGKGDHIKYGLYKYYAKETAALMLLHSWYKFQFAQDQHGGTETYLWPYGGISTRPKDEDWYEWLCDKLVEQIHDDCKDNGYMTSCGGDGIGNIYHELYQCHGIRCDMNDWVGNGKSITLESSVKKLLNEGDLQRHWEYCREALFMSYEILYKYGLQGIVVDSQFPDRGIIKVEISRNGDIPNGTVLTDSTGRYVKYMKKGTYTLTFKHEDYVTREFSDITIDDYEERIDLHVKLWPKNPTGINNNLSFVENTIRIIPYKKGIKINSANLGNNVNIGIYNISGKLVTMLPVSTASSILWDGMNSNGRVISNGCYIVKIMNNNQKLSQCFILNR